LLQRTHFHATLKMTTTKDAIMGLIGAREKDPKCLEFTYGSESKLEKNVQTAAKMPNAAGGCFSLTVDEPATMPGGGNAGPNPLDVMCASLGTCQEITYKLYATVMEVPLKSVSATVKGDINLSGFVGVGDKVGFNNIDVEIALDAPDASDAQLEQLKAAVDSHCPLLSTLSGEVATTTELVKVASEGKTSDAAGLKEGVMQVVEVGKKDEKALKATYSSTSKLAGAGLRTDVELPGGHKLIVDEPTNMPGGTNEGPNPLDLFCTSFGTCQEITYKYYAGVMGINVDSVSCKVDAPIDLGGLVGIKDAGVGLKAVTGKISIETDASQEQLDQLKAAVDAHCPMTDTLKSKTPVSLKMLRAK